MSSVRASNCCTSLLLDVCHVHFLVLLGCHVFVLGLCHDVQVLSQTSLRHMSDAHCARYGTMCSLCVSRTAFAHHLATLIAGSTGRNVEITSRQAYDRGLAVFCSWPSCRDHLGLWFIAFCTSASCRIAIELLELLMHGAKR